MEKQEKLVLSGVWHLIFFMLSVGKLLLMWTESDTNPNVYIHVKITMYIVDRPQIVPYMKKMQFS